MHKPVINPDVVRRVTERGEVVYACSTASFVSELAHIIVDLQNGFMAPGQVAEITPPPRKSCPRSTGSAPPSARRERGVVVYIQNTF